MRKIAPRVFQESKYQGVYLGMIQTGDDILLIDAPIKLDDASEWLEEVRQKGDVRYLALLDSHPDRVIGARAYDLPIIAHLETMEDMRTWSDTFKGATHPLGSEVDRIKRITGVQKSIPELVFSTEMRISAGDREIVFMHKPGPRTGSMWIFVPDQGILFCGDLVTVEAPPYFGAIDLEMWLESLEALREYDSNGIQIASSRDGLINRDDINSMARFVRKIPVRASKVLESDDMEAEAESQANDLIGDFKLHSTDPEQARSRLRASLLDFAHHQQNQAE